MDRSPKIGASALAARSLAAHQPGAHSARQPSGEFMGGGDGIRVGDMAQVGGAQVLGSCGAAAPAAAISRIVALRTLAPLGVIGQAGLFLRHARGGELALSLAPPGRAAGYLLATAHAAPQPVGLEDFVEALPILMGRAEEGAQGRRQRGWPLRRRRGENRQSIARLGQPDRKAAVAESTHETCQLPANADADAHAGFLAGNGAHQATLPRSRSVTSRGTRARSSWVFSRQIKLS